MKTKLLSIVSILIILQINCSSFKTEQESWEGISENVLKTTISELFPFEENISNDYIKKLISERLNQRASLLIASYISINLSKKRISHDTDVVLNELISNTISSGKLIHYECSENNYCYAIGEYNILKLQKKLDSLNMQE